MNSEQQQKKITRWKPLSSRPTKGQPNKMGRCFTRPSNHEDQELEDVRLKEGALEGNC
jgi:hypothetical protein